MKILGIILIVAGLALTIYTGINFVTKKKVVDIGAIEITKDEEKNVGWSPFIGVAVMALGATVLYFGNRKQAAF